MFRKILMLIVIKHFFFYFVLQNGLASGNVVYGYLHNPCILKIPKTETLISCNPLYSTLYNYVLEVENIHLSFEREALVIRVRNYLPENACFA